MTKTSEASTPDAGKARLDARVNPHPDFPTPTELIDPHRCPVVAYARTLLRRALEDDPALRTAALTPSTIIIVEVPSPDLIDPVAETWRAEILATDAVPTCGDDLGVATGPWLEFRRDGWARPAKSDAGRIADALAAGKPVFAFSDNPRRAFPADMLRVADRRLALAPLDGSGLAAALALHHGVPVTQVPDDADARLVTPDDLLLARRPGADADAHLRRALALASGRRSSDDQAVLLQDLFGMDEAVRWGLDLKRDLDMFHTGRIRWSEVDRGVLVHGPTGTGKTTFARALAATCEVPLVVGSLGAWQACGTGHLGDMLKAMRSTFDEARRAAPCILFIDEIDGIGNRATFHSRHREYSVQVLNSLLELLDGVQSREGVVVVAATNRPEAIDPALLRPGRLDRMLYIGLPDSEALTGILRHHLGEDLTEADVSWLARASVGATGAHMEQAVRGMRRRARRENRAPTLADLEAELTGGRAPVPDAARYRIAIHEAGHAVATAVRRPGALRSVSVPRTARGGGILGEMQSSGDGFDPSGGDRQVTRETVLDTIAERLAGRAAEWVMLTEVSAGAGGTARSDIAMATWLATCAVSAFGLADDAAEAPLWLGLPTPEQTPEVLAVNEWLSQQVSQLMADGYARAVALIREHEDGVVQVAVELLDRETLTGTEVEEIVRRAAGAVQ